MQSILSIILVLLVCILSACSSKDPVTPSADKKEKVEVLTQKPENNQEEKDAISEEQPPANALPTKSSLFYKVTFHDAVPLP